MGPHARPPATILSVIVMLVIALLPAAASAEQRPSPATQDAPTAEERGADAVRLKEVREILEIRQHILDKYVGEPVDGEEIHEALLKGMVDGLRDPYSQYLTNEEAQALENDLNGKFTGIGIKLDMHGETPVVTLTIKDGPAERAGLRKGDRIVAVNGVRTKKLPGSRVVSMLKGDAGTAVHVTVDRDGCDTEETFRIVRADIVVKPVTYAVQEVRGRTIGIVTLSAFGETTGTLFNDATNQALRDKVDGLVVDIRDNSGGYLGAVQFVACQWLPRSAVVAWEHERTARTPLTCPHNRAPLGNVPTALLINGRSASASEILAGALQDHDKAVLVGETTYGKGVGQKIIPLSSGARLKLTTFEWRTPKRRRINKKGVEPDVKVAPKPDGAEESDPDPQLLKAFDALVASPAEN